jgi:hypothetical protein
MLDLDISKSIKELKVSVNPKYMGDLLYGLIETIKKYGKYIGDIYIEYSKIFQYTIPVKYLSHTFYLVFEFDHSIQYINIVYYNHNQSKTYLKIFLSINDEPTIKYLENDKSGYVSGYSDDKIFLRPGEYLVNFAHCLMSYIGFYRMRLDDDSYLITKNKNNEEIKTKLWLYYLIKNKRSWYAKFGYIPGNCTINEYHMLIGDVCSIKLDEISLKLKQILSASNNHQFDQGLMAATIFLVEHIGQSSETLYEYTINHCLEDFTLLTNQLFQSFFSRNLNILNSNQNKKNSKNDDDESDDEICASSHTTIDFPWFNTIKKLLVVNVMQINNNISNHYYKLEKK